MTFEQYEDLLRASLTWNGRPAPLSKRLRSEAARMVATELQTVKEVTRGLSWSESRPYIDERIEQLEAAIR